MITAMMGIYHVGRVLAIITIVSHTIPVQVVSPHMNNNLVHTSPGSSWSLVRHVPQGKQWHKATDQLMGTDVYGDPAMGLGTQFSVVFDNEDYNQVITRLILCTHIVSF